MGDPDENCNKAESSPSVHKSNAYMNPLDEMNNFEQSNNEKRDDKFNDDELSNDTESSRMLTKNIDQHINRLQEMSLSDDDDMGKHKKSPKFFIQLLFSVLFNIFIGRFYYANKI